MPDILINDPVRGVVKVVPHLSSKVSDRELGRALLACLRDEARTHKRFVYDRHGEPLGIVTFEPCRFDPHTGRKTRRRR